MEKFINDCFVIKSMEKESQDEEFYDGEVDDEDIYSENGTEELEENDVINPEEEAFMQGYNKAAVKHKKKKIAA